MSHALWRAMTADTMGSMQITRVLAIDSKNSFTSGELVVWVAVFLFL